MVRGDVHWVKFKDPMKPRPALIITRNDAIRDLNSLTVIPITTTMRVGPTSVWLDEGDGMPKPCVISIDNIQTVPKEKIGAYITHVDREKMYEVFDAIKFAFAFAEN